MSLSKFEELEIYQLAEKLSDIIWDIVIKWDSFPRITIGTQFVDASDSFGANIEQDLLRYHEVHYSRQNIG
jgi:hypothetical protein